MRLNPYDIIGVSPLASDEEVKTAYRTLARKYHADNYPEHTDFVEDDGELHDRAWAAAKMKEINAAYDDILMARSGGKFDMPGDTNYGAVRDMISANRFAEAEKTLDDMPEWGRGAEWHFLKSICLDRRGMTSDAMNELNIACQMDPKNEEYSRSRNIYYQRAGQYGNAYRTRQGGGASSADSICNCCTNLIIADCCCECMGGDLCGCI